MKLIQGLINMDFVLFTILFIMLIIIILGIKAFDIELQKIWHAIQYFREDIKELKKIILKKEVKDDKEL